MSCLRLPRGSDLVSYLSNLVRLSFRKKKHVPKSAFKCLLKEHCRHKVYIIHILEVKNSNCVALKQNEQTRS